HTVLGRVPSVRRLNRTTAHTRKTTPLRTSNLHHAIALSPNTRLILRHKRHTLTQARSSLRRNNLDLPAIRKTNELLARPCNHIIQRTLLNHRTQRTIRIIRLVLSSRSHLDKRGRPRTPHCIPRRVLKHPPTTAAMIRTTVLLAPRRPPGKQRRANTLKTNKRRNQRRLPPLLRPHQLRTTILESIRPHPRPSVILHRVMPRHKRELLRHKIEKLALIVTIRDHTMSLNPLQRNIKRLRHPSPAPLDAHAPTSAESAQH